MSTGHYLSSAYEALDETDKAFLHSLIPDDAIPTGLITIVTWLDPDTGETRWRRYSMLDLESSTTIGLLELVKATLIDHVLCPDYDDDGGDE